MGVPDNTPFDNGPQFAYKIYVKFFFAVFNF